jgi:hypothetical protein
MIRPALPGRLILVFLLLIAAGPLTAQEFSEDVVYLKNGSIIRGTILEQKPGEYIKIATHDRNIWVFKMEEVEKITRETVVIKGKEPVMLRPDGYYNVSEVGFSISRQMWGGYSTGFSANTINGYKFNRFLATGVLVGIDHYYGLPMIPMGVDVRGTLLKRSVSPYYYAQAAYSVPMPYENDLADYDGDIMLQAGMGMLFAINEDFGMVISTGYKVQKLTKRYENWGGSETTENNSYKRISFKLGLMF